MLFKAPNFQDTYKTQNAKNIECWVFTFTFKIRNLRNMISKKINLNTILNNCNL